MRRRARRAAAWLCLWAAAGCRITPAAGAEGAAKPAARWFGAAREDFARAKELSGLPLKIKARFVRALAPEARRRGAPPRDVLFLVEAEGGRIACSLPRGAKETALVGELKHATPLVIRGTVDAKKRVFLVRGIAQGWGKGRLGGDE